VCQEQEPRTRSSREAEGVPGEATRVEKEYHIKDKKVKAEIKETKDPKEDTLFQAA